MTEPSPTQPATWIFQANPSKYDIETSLRKEATELWNCMQHAAHIKSGDRVLVWISGKRAGVYAVGEVLSTPETRPDSAVGQRYWKSASDGRAARPRALVRYDRVLLERPLLRTYLMWDPPLANLRILAQPRGTNFPVTPEEWTAIAAWLED